MPYLEVLNGPEVGKQAPIAQDTFFMGRDPNNHLVLTDRTVSRKHAVINQIEGKYIVTDLKSLKGILVNGVKKEEAVLEDGDEIAVGAVRLRFYGEQGESRDLGLGIAGRRKKRRLWIFLAFLLVITGLGVFYLWQGVPVVPKNFADMQALEEHYERGVFLFNNERDVEGAKREWQKVLELDPARQTPYGQKASKLLENLK